MEVLIRYATFSIWTLVLFGAIRNPRFRTNHWKEPFRTCHEWKAVHHANKQMLFGLLWKSKKKKKAAIETAWFTLTAVFSGGRVYFSMETTCRICNFLPPGTNRRRTVFLVLKTNCYNLFQISRNVYLIFVFWFSSLCFRSGFIFTFFCFCFVWFCFLIIKFS